MTTRSSVPTTPEITKSRPRLDALPDDDREYVHWLAGRQIAQEAALRRVEDKLDHQEERFRTIMAQYSAIPGAGLVNIIGGSIEGQGATGPGAMTASLLVLVGVLFLPKLKVGIKVGIKEDAGKQGKP